MKKRPFLSKNLHFYCPGCKKLIATAKKDIFSGDNITNCDFAFEFNTPKAYETPVCPCGMQLYMFRFKEYWS